MKIFEFANDGIKTYLASVRVVVTGIGTATCKVSVQTDSMNAARLMLSRIYGKDNLLSLKEVVLGETTGSQQTTAQDLQVKSLMNQSSQLKNQAKKVKSLQKLQRAQKDFAQVSSTSNQQTS